MFQNPSIETTTAAIPERSGGALLGHADVLLEALTADKDHLFNVIRDSREEVLLAALRTRSLSWLFCAKSLVSRLTCSRSADCCDEMVLLAFWTKRVRKIQSDQ